jgi:hypothetical protein
MQNAECGHFIDRGSGVKCATIIAAVRREVLSEF